MIEGQRNDDEQPKLDDGALTEEKFYKAVEEMAQPVHEFEEQLPNTNALFAHESAVPTPEDEIEPVSTQTDIPYRNVLFSPAPEDDGMAVLNFVCTPTVLPYEDKDGKVDLHCWSRADYKDAKAAVLTARRLKAVGQTHDVVNDFIARRTKRLQSEAPEGEA